MMPARADVDIGVIPCDALVEGDKVISCAIKVVASYADAVSIVA